MEEVRRIKEQLDQENLELERILNQQEDLDALRRILEEDDQLAARTLAFLDGDLEAETDMSANDKLVSMRLPSDELERAEALLKEMAEHKDWRGFGMTRSAVLRMALIRGLDALQEQYGSNAQK